MNRFIQLHILTAYPPANLNRDDLGRPKTAKMGGTDRLRISSQSLKRTWRTSDLFQEAMAGHIGTRTKKLGCVCYETLLAGGVKDKDALIWAKAIAGQFGALKKDKGNPLNELEIEQLVHVSVTEQVAIDSLVKLMVSEHREATEQELELLRQDNHSTDIALFGRMLASKPSFNVEAACQVAHAISVHSVVIEDDYFTAVDDLNDKSVDAGAAHIGETGFAAGLFYSYVCINRQQLIDNLSGDERLAEKAIRALTEAAVKVAPAGKQNSFGSRAYASYVMAESGDQQPRSLSVAFLKPIDQRSSDDFASDSITALERQQEYFDETYGTCAEHRCVINAIAPGGSTLNDLLTFVASD